MKSSSLFSLILAFLDNIQLSKNAIATKCFQTSHMKTRVDIYQSLNLFYVRFHEKNSVANSKFLPETAYCYLSEKNALKKLKFDYLVVFI